MRAEPIPMPAPIRSNVPGSFAWGVLHQRHPTLIAKLREQFPYPPDRQRALDDLLAEITVGTITPLPCQAHDHAEWDRWGAEYFGQPWPDVPFLWAESYFYRKLLQAVGYCDPGPWRGVDLFEPQKAAELADPSLDQELAGLGELTALPEDERTAALLTTALWGNRADLGFRLSDPGSQERDPVPDLVVDDSAALVRHLRDGAAGLVCVIADNTGRELLGDLALIDHLLRTGQAEQVELHLKPHPYYISDATGDDLLACLRRLTAAEGEAAAIGARLWKALTDGQLLVQAPAFYCSPLPYHDLPTELIARFSDAKLVIVKGDLNYRRLVGDRHWPATASFTTLTSYLPAPVATLRTLKSDVVVGVDPDTLAGLEASGEAWRTSGTHAMIQFRS